MSLYSRLDRLAADVEKLNRQVTAVANSPQSQRTSVEGGSIDFNDADGNLMAVVGGQDDGSNTIRHVDGPTPPIPSGLSAHVDGPIVQVSWDGTFESDVTHDWHYLEVLAVGPNDKQLTGTINDLSGGETSLAATSQGDWVITARSVSRAGKRSLDGDAGTVAVQLVGLTGAIDAIQESANGKNTIYYSPTEPTPPELGFNNGDLWFDTSEEGNNTASVWDGNGWVSMEDARLATIIAAQEALESDLQDVQTSVDGKNTITYDPALPPASYVGAVGDTWYRTSDNSMIGFWKWDGAAWVQQELSTTVIPQIDIGAGTFGTMSGTRLQAGTVSTSMLAVGVGGNLLPDPHFLDPAMSAIRAGTQWTYKTVSGETCFERVMPSPGSTANLPLTDKLGNEYYLPAAPGVKNVMELDVSGPVTVYLYFYMSDGSLWAPGTSIQHDLNTARRVARFEFNPDSHVAANGAIVERFSLRVRQTTSSVTAPPGTVTRVFSARVSPMSGATVIENGAITTDKLAVGSITAESGIIESLDLGTATVGELDGIRIMGKTVRGEQLSGDAIDGKVITAPTIQSARSGRRWVGDPNGIRIINEDDDVRTQLSPDGSTFKGEVEADTLVVNEGAEFKANNTLAQGANLTLAAGVTDPTAPPVVQPYWEGLEASESLENALGLAWDGANYWTVDASMWGTEKRFIRINGSTGEITRFGHATALPNLSGLFGVTCIGSELFWLYRSGYEGRILVTDLDCVKKREMPWSLGYSKTNPLTYKPGIGNDGTNIVIAHCTDSGRLDIHTCNKTTGAIISTVNDSADLTRSDITGVYVGNADWGRKLVTVAKKSNWKIPSFSATTGVYDGAATQFDAASPNSTGVVFVDGKWRTLDPSGVIHEYSDNNTGDNSGDWWATYYWYTDVDDDNVIESSDYRSRMAPPARFVWPRRAMLKILGQPMPTGVEALGPALAKKTTTPVRTDFSGPGWQVDAGKPSARYVTLPTNWTTYASPSATNTYPEAESSVLESASGTFRVQGDGSGHWGPLTMGRNGVMSGLVVSGEVLVTPSAANTPTKFTVTLPPGRFAKPPIVWVQPSTAIPHLVQVGCYQPDTPATFDLYLTRYNTSPTGVTWFAMDRE